MQNLTQDQISDKQLLQTLFKISNAVNTTDNLDDLFISIHQALEDVIDVTNFAIGLYDKEKDFLSYPYYVDETGDVYEQIENVTDTVIMAKDVIYSKKEVFLSRAEAIARAKKQGKEVAGSIPEQWLGIPLKIKEEVIGVIVVQSYKDSDRYQKKDADILMSISEQVAIAIDRKRAQENLLRSEKLNRTLFNIANAVIISKNLDDLYRSIFEALNNLKPLPNFIITIYNKYENSLFFPLHIDEFDSEENVDFYVNNIDECSYICIDVIKSKQSLFLTHEMLLERDKKMGTLGTIPAVWLGVPLIIQDEVIGTLTVQHYTEPDYFTQQDMELFIAASRQVALAIERKRAQTKLTEIQQELIDQAHKAGMADLASNTIHNIGNILNSLNTSASMMRATLKHSSIQHLEEANSLLKENLPNIESFIKENPKGKKLLEYYLVMGESFLSEASLLNEGILRVMEKIEMIDLIVQSQKKYINLSATFEEYPLETLIEDVLNIQSAFLSENNIRVNRQFQGVAPIPIQKAKLINILAEIIKNAVEAMKNNAEKDRLLTIQLDKEENQTEIKITDTGHGIEANEMKSIFSQEIKRKEKNSSLSLHNCANYMTEMGGVIEVYSSGRGQGATFCLKFSSKKQPNSG